MLTQFLYSLPLIIFLTLGSIHLSQLGYLRGVIDLASFAAVRSEFIGGNPDVSAHFVVAGAMDPRALLEDRSSRLSLPQVELNWLTENGKTEAQLELPYPNALLPNAVQTFHCLSQPLRCMEPQKGGATPPPLPILRTQAPLPPRRIP